MKRRVLLLAPSPPPYGGMALQARLLENLLIADGYDVRFVASNAVFPRWLGWAARIAGIRTVVRSGLLWMQLWRQVRHVEVVHVLAASWFYFWAAVTPAVILGRLYGRRIVLNYRGGEARQFFGRWGWAVKPILRLGDIITVPSRFLAEVFQDCFSLRVSIVPNILNNSEFRYRQRAAFQPKMLVTRHLEKIYDVESVLRAFGSVQEQYHEASLWIAGTGSQREMLQNRVSEWGLKNVRFLGHVAHEDLPGIYDHCDILLNASRVDNFPGALVEASASGLVVISTAAGGIPAMYEDGNTAFLVEPGDWQALALAVTKVLQYPALASQITLRAAALVRSCEWPEVKNLLYRAYGFEAVKTNGENYCATVAGNR
jgi:glycosyltransferase involved in cell wall biosynthesis